MILNVLVKTGALGMVAYHLINSFYILGEPEQIQNYHLAFAFSLVFLSGIQKSKKWLSLDLALLILGLVATGYIQIYFDDLRYRVGFPTPWDLIIGVILIVLCLEGSRRSFGAILPAIVVFYIAYAFLGHYLPQPFQTMQFPLPRLLSKLTMLSGIYGVVLGVSVKYIFLFIVFGAALKVSGTPRFFMQIARLLGSKTRGGMGMTAVVASGLLGMVSGTVTGNVATTGPFTIPAMKQAGYKPHQAAAIEATASTGGMIMPPVMAGTAFIMSAFTGIPYINLCLAAAIPALLFYFSAGLYVLFQGMKLNLVPPHERVDTREVLIYAPLFIVPLLVLIILMAIGFSPMFAVSRSFLLIVLLSLMRKETRASLSQWVQGLTEAALLGARLGVILALVGIIVGTSIMTGLGIKLPAAIEGWSGNHLAVALMITAVIALVLGCGMEIAAVYVLVAIMAAPALIRMGLTVLQAHMFAFYFSIMSFVTPPVAIAALVASPLAGAPFLKTAVEATKVAVAGFIIPFLLVLCPILMLQPESPLSAAMGLVSAMMILISLQIVICNYYLTQIRPLERALFLAVVSVLLVSLAVGSTLLFSVGMAVFIAASIWQLRKRNRAPDRF